MIECTRGNKCRIYHYTGERVELDPPMEVKLEDTTVLYKYSNKVSKDIQSDQSVGIWSDYSDNETDEVDEINEDSEDDMVIKV